MPLLPCSDQRLGGCAGGASEANLHISSMWSWNRLVWGGVVIDERHGPCRTVESKGVSTEIFRVERTKTKQVKSCDGSTRLFISKIHSILKSVLWACYRISRFKLCAWRHQRCLSPWRPSPSTSVWLRESWQRSRRLSWSSLLSYSLLFVRDHSVSVFVRVL